MKVVIPSVNYAGELAVIVPAWHAILPTGVDLIVVTTADDAQTQATAAAAGARVVITDAWRRDGARFNKAAALDEALYHAGRPATGEVCLTIDADAYPVGTLPSVVDADVLYGCDRYLCRHPSDLARFQQGSTRAGDLFSRRNSGQAGAGYFQLFRYRPGLTFGSYPTAGHYDLDFHRWFHRVERLTSIDVIHLGRTNSRNWSGRVLPPWGSATRG